MTFISGRVTQRSLNASGYASIQDGAQRVAKAREQVTSGKAINRPSDNVTGNSTAMRSRADIAERSRWVRSGEDGISRLNAADGALSTVTDALQRVKELAVLSQNGTVDQVSRDAIASEIESLRSASISAFNANYLGRPVFGGTINGTRAYDDTGAYIGNNAPLIRTVGVGQKVDVGVDAQAVIGPDGSNLFDSLTALADAIRNNDQATIQATDTELDAHRSNIIAARADVGLRTNQIERAMTETTSEIGRLEQTLSNAEDVDMAKAILDLNVYEASYQAALAGTAKALQPSLLNFLR